MLAYNSEVEKWHSTSQTGKNADSNNNAWIDLKDKDVLNE